MIKKISSYISRLSKREKLVLYGAVFFVSLVFVDQLILGSILSKIQFLDREIESQKTTVKRSLHILAQGDRIKKDVEKYTFFVMPARSPEEEVAFFLKDIEELANKSSVYVIDMKSTSFFEESIFNKYIVKLNCEAQIEQIVTFFYEVENSNRMLKVEKYDMRPKTAGSSILRCTASISKVVVP